jgi:hypothetical protein
MNFGTVKKYANVVYEKFESITNAPYPIAGLLWYIQSGAMVMTLIPWLGMIVLGVQSFFFHKYKESNSGDRNGMAIAFTTITGMLWSNSPHAEYIWGGLFITLILYGFLVLKKFRTNLEVGISVAGTLVSSFLVLGLVDTLIAFGILGTAYLVKQIDAKKNNIDTHYDSKPHGWWHIITSIGMWYIGYAFIKMLLAVPLV